MNKVVRSLNGPKRQLNPPLDRDEETKCSENKGL